MTAVDQKVISWATAQEESFALLPPDVDIAKVTLDITMGCPPGGCDPWVRLGYLNVLHPTGELADDGSPVVEQIELARFITPYDIGSGFGGPGACPCGWRPHLHFRVRERSLCGHLSWIEPYAGTGEGCAREVPACSVVQGGP